MGDAADSFGLSVPARAELIGTLRVFVSTIARHYELNEDGVEDVKLAVSETAAAAIDAGLRGRIDVIVEAASGVIGVRVVCPAWSESRWLPIEAPEGIDPRSLDRFEVVRALFADADRSEAGGAVTVRFSTPARTSTR